MDHKYLNQLGYMWRRLVKDSATKTAANLVAEAIRELRGKETQTLSMKEPFTADDAPVCASARPVLSLNELVNEALDCQGKLKREPKGVPISLEAMVPAGLEIDWISANFVLTDSDLESELTLRTDPDAGDEDWRQRLKTDENESLGSAMLLGRSDLCPQTQETSGEDSLADFVVWAFSALGDLGKELEEEKRQVRAVIQATADTVAKETVQQCTSSFRDILSQKERDIQDLTRQVREKDTHITRLKQINSDLKDSGDALSAALKDLQERHLGSDSELDISYNEEEFGEGETDIVVDDG